MFYLIHELTHIGRNGVHAQCVQAAVKHMGLYAYLVKGLGECTDGQIGVLTVKQVNLLHGTSVGLYTVKASHVNDYGSYLG